MPAEKDDLSTLLFLALAFLLSACFWTLMIRAGHIGAGGGHYVEALMWSPAIAAVVTVWVRRLDIGTLGLSTIGGVYAIVGYVTPLAYAAIAYGLVWGLGFGTFPDPATIEKISARLGWQAGDTASFVVLYFLLTATTGIIVSTAHALGEEIGWRGFLAPRLAARLGFTGGALVTGVIWTAWHMPILLFADYNSGTEWWFALSCFAVLVVEISVILAWLRLRSKSVWPCALLHGSHNLFIQAYFTPLTGAKGTLTAYAIDEFGLAVPAVALVFALLFWLARDRATGGEPA
jgi:membrane protease YdiL (CAAX protease family)